MMRKRQAKKKVFKVCSKWILAGEHSVLRGYPALVFPLKSHFMELSVWEEQKTSKKNLQFYLKELSYSSSSLQDVFKKTLNLALKKLPYVKKKYKTFSLRLKSNVEPSLGLGSSSMVSVLIGLWFKEWGWIIEKQLASFCYQLEKTLQKESSGLDIVAVLKSKPLMYQILPNKKFPLPSFLLGSQKAYTLELTPLLWVPHIYLSKPKLVASPSSTGSNILKMKNFIKTKPKKSIELDTLMKEAVGLAKQALTKKMMHNRLRALRKSLSLSETCFRKWGLIDPSVRAHAKFLKQKGALATKPTGSGGSSYVISLWKSSPPSSIRIKFFPGFFEEKNSLKKAKPCL